MGEVRELRPDVPDGGGPVRTARRTCYHHQAELVEDSHEVRCRKCDAKLDPWEVLHGIARNRERYEGERKELLRQIDRLRERVADLKREERNVKARLRRARG